MDILIVVDMQNDFVSGSLGSDMAKAIVPYVVDKIKDFEGRVIFTRDTHSNDYLSTKEGENLPVKHCIKDTWGWEIVDELKEYVKEEPINKGIFGSMKLADLLQQTDKKEKIKSITFIGLCTDICVISNAIIAKSAVSEADIIVDGKGCAGVTEESHRNALEAMKMCQIIIQ